MEILNLRQQEIRQKGFDMNVYQQEPNTDFSKIKVGPKTLEDAILNLGTFKKMDSRLGDKKEVLNAIYNGDTETMRDISNFFFKTSGIYSRLCRYMAYLYRYDWMVTPYVNDQKYKTEKMIEEFHKALNFLDDFGIKKFCGEVALKVIKNGCYYGYCVEGKDKTMIQELPPNYARSRYSVNGKPVIEFNMKYFDDQFRDTTQKIKILKLFPKEFKKGYVLYKEGKLQPDFQGDSSGWFVLDPDKTVKFNLNEEDYPAFISVIPAIIDLDEAQELDRKKMQQRLLKIIIQKMPLDKQGELIFDVDEARELHNNAVRMLNKAIGIDVLTTFADVEVADTSDNASVSATDDLERVERAIYNEAGVSQMQFNTDGNIALEKSILNDEAAMYNLLVQFETFFNGLLKPFNRNPKKVCYKMQLLTTTIYNYKDMAKLYKEQTSMGYSKILPQLALGQTQSSVLANAYFENQILELYKVFIPPVNTNTMSAEMLLGEENKETSNSKKSSSQNQDSEGQVGRPQKEDSEKSEKTIQNQESMN